MSGGRFSLGRPAEHGLGHDAGHLGDPDIDMGLTRMCNIADAPQKVWPSTADPFAG